jgi:hypothetical protein
MTVQNLIDAISEALFQEFGEGYDIYAEKVEQGLETPCFLIRCLNPTQNLDLGLRYRKTNQFAVQYMPSTVEALAECHGVVERLFVCLENVVSNNRIFHGTGMNGEITDGILTFTVNYDGFVMKERTENTMDNIELFTQVKG